MKQANPYSPPSAAVEDEADLFVDLDRHNRIAAGCRVGLPGAKPRKA
jgi:hypothetical protein